MGFKLFNLQNSSKKGLILSFPNLISPIVKTDKALNSFVFIYYLRVEFHHLFLPPNFPRCV
jgi:hypothetical protein